jgi:hypothetical protein
VPWWKPGKRGVIESRGYSTVKHMGKMVEDLARNQRVPCKHRAVANDGKSHSGKVPDSHGQQSAKSEKVKSI